MAPRSGRKNYGRRRSIEKAMRRNEEGGIFDGEEALREVAKVDGKWNWAMVGPDPDDLPLSGGGLGNLSGMQGAMSQHAHSFGLMRLLFRNDSEEKTFYLFVHASDSANIKKFPMRTRGTAMMMEPKMEAAIKKFVPYDAKVDITSQEECTVDNMIAGLLEEERFEYADLITKDNCVLPVEPTLPRRMSDRTEPIARRKSNQTTGTRAMAQAEEKPVALAVPSEQEVAEIEQNAEQQEQTLETVKDDSMSDFGEDSDDDKKAEESPKDSENVVREQTADQVEKGAEIVKKDSKGISGEGAQEDAENSRDNEAEKTEQKAEESVEESIDAKPAEQQQETSEVDEKVEGANEEDPKDSEAKVDTVDEQKTDNVEEGAAEEAKAPEVQATKSKDEEADTEQETKERTDIAEKQTAETTEVSVVDEQADGVEKDEEGGKQEETKETEDTAEQQTAEANEGHALPAAEEQAVTDGAEKAEEDERNGRETTEMLEGSEMKTETPETPDPLGKQETTEMLDENKGPEAQTTAAHTEEKAATTPKANQEVEESKSVKTEDKAETTPATKASQEVDESKSVQTDVTEKTEDPLHVIPRPHAVQPALDVSPYETPQAMPVERQREKVKLYQPGDVVEIYSEKDGKWMADGEVEEVTSETIQRDGYIIRAGSMKVTYCNGMRYKWISAAHMEQYLRPSPRPRPPDPLVGELLKETHSWFSTWWEECYCELNKGFLMWWDSVQAAQNGYKPTGSLYLLGLDFRAECKTDKTGNQAHVMKLRSASSHGALYTFKHAGGETLSEWTETLWAHAGYCEEADEFYKARGAGNEMRKELLAVLARKDSKQHRKSMVSVRSRNSRLSGVLANGRPSGYPLLLPGGMIDDYIKTPSGTAF